MLRSLKHSIAPIAQSPRRWWGGPPGPRLAPWPAQADSSEQQKAGRRKSPRHTRATATLQLAAALVVAVAVYAADPPEYTQAVKLVEAQNWPAAHQQIGDLLARYPGNPKVLNLQGLAFLGEGKSKEAIAAFESALRSDPGFFPALKNLTIHERTIGRQPSARRHLEAALNLEPGDPVLNVYGALDSLEQRNYPAAKRRLQIGSAK